MSGCRRLVVLAVFAIALVAALAPAAAAAPAINGVFKVPGVTGNNKIVAGTDGNIWVTIGGEAANVARVTPAGEVKEFELGLKNAQGIAIGPEGKLWVAAEKAVASFSPSDPEGTKEKTEIAGIETFYSISAGGDGRMWVATFEKVLRFLPATPSLVQPIAVAGLSPRDIDAVGNTVAVADAGAPRIVYLSASEATPAPHEYIYGAEGGSQGLAFGPTGQIAFSDPGATPEQVGLVSPPIPATTQEQLGDPFGVTYGPDGNFWIAMFAEGGVLQLTPGGKKTFLGGLTKMSPRQITAGANHTLWVTLEKTGEEGVARISGVEPVVVPPVAPPTTPPPAAPQTKIAKGPKHEVTATGKRTKVSFRFSSPTAGVRFECALTKAVKGKKPKRPSFAGCASPKTLKLSLGSYRFQVRAVNGTVADATPAATNFRIVAAQPPHRHHR